jgi:hypothetical protein
MFTAYTHEIEDVLKQSNGLIFTFAIRQENRKIRREISRLYHKMFERFACSQGLIPQIHHGRGLFKGHFKQSYKWFNRF